MLPSGDLNGLIQLNGKSLPGAVISVEGVSGKFDPPSTPYTVELKDNQFLPRVIAVVKSSKVRFTNSDPIFHNIFSSSRLKIFNVSQQGKGDFSQVAFDECGVVPVRSHVDTQMRGCVVVLPNPYFTVTTGTGQYLIKDIPPGKYTVRVWSEQGALSSQKIEVTANGRTVVNFNLKL